MVENGFGIRDRHYSTTWIVTLTRLLLFTVPAFFPSVFYYRLQYGKQTVETVNEIERRKKKKLNNNRHTLRIGRKSTNSVHSYERGGAGENITWVFEIIGKRSVCTRTRLGRISSIQYPIWRIKYESNSRRIIVGDWWSHRNIRLFNSSVLLFGQQYGVTVNKRISDNNSSNNNNYYYHY